MCAILARYARKKPFRTAYAHEIAENLPKIVPEWVKKCWTQGWSLRDAQATLPPVTDWRHATTKRMLICILNDEMEVNELASRRGGEALILAKLFDMELKHLNLTFSQAMSMSFWHREAIVDMLRMTGHI